MTLLKKAVEQYAYAMDLFDTWAKPGGQRARSKTDVAKALLNPQGKALPEAQQLEYLRRQIEMRVLGLGWTQYCMRRAGRRRRTRASARSRTCRPWRAEEMCR